MHDDAELKRNGLALLEVLGLAMTQADFGHLVGISQQAVSALCARGVLLEGQSGQQWLSRYLTNLREQAIARISG